MEEGFKSLRVLLVDDYQHMRRIVASMLSGLGVGQVREVRDGADALKVLKNWAADIAIVDFLMAPMDGLEFTRLVRNDPSSLDPYLPIIMMTGYSERFRVTEARDAGVTEFVAKPLTARALFTRLQTVVLNPRPFVRAEDYFGPDRRRKAEAGHPGPFRRQLDAQTASGD